MVSNRLYRIKDWGKVAEDCDYRVEKMARRFQVSQRTLERFFLERFNTTPKGRIDELRAEAAAKEILDGEVLKKVASDVGCKHASSLTRLFKRVKGTTPKDYGVL